MKCECGSEDVIVYSDMGYDVFDEGEERQHVDVCKSCCKWRFHSDIKYWIGKHEEVFGPWQDKSVPHYLGI